MKATGFLETIRDWCNGRFLYSIPIATTETLGGIKPDGTSIVVDESGTAKVISTGDGNNYNILSTLSQVEQNTESGNLVDAIVIKEVFQFVSEGKRLIALAITDKGVDTSAENAFTQMAQNISLIQGDMIIEQKSNFSMVVREGTPLLTHATNIDAFVSPSLKSCVKANISVKEG